jgi:hypothetical protein
MSTKTLQWNEKDQYAQTSKDGCYSVCAIGYAQGKWFYEAWATRAHEDGSHLISTNLPTAAEARAMCEADAND